MFVCFSAVATTSNVADTELSSLHKYLSNSHHIPLCVLIRKTGICKNLMHCCVCLCYLIFSISTNSFFYVVSAFVISCFPISTKIFFYVVSVFAISCFSVSINIFFYVVLVFVISCFSVSTDNLFGAVSVFIFPSLSISTNILFGIIYFLFFKHLIWFTLFLYMLFYFFKHLIWHCVPCFFISANTLCGVVSVFIFLCFSIYLLVL